MFNTSLLVLVGYPPNIDISDRYSVFPTGWIWGCSLKIATISIKNGSHH